MNDGPMTTGQYLQARRIKAHKPNATVAYIALHVSATQRQVRKALDRDTAPAKVPRAKKKLTRLRPGLKVTGYSPCGHRKAAGIAEPGHMVVPRDVMLEREQRLAQSPRSLTAALFGDPLPGRSALDKRYSV